MGSRALLGIGLALGLALPASASATTWDVTNTGDDPPTCPSSNACTLRGAIDDADLGAGGDVVQVPAGHYTLNVNPLNVNVAMQIVGTAGPTATTVELVGTTTNGIFAISSGASDVTISGLTLTGGHQPNGGAIASQAAALTLTNDAFTGNTPEPGAHGSGGAVDVSGSPPTTLTVANSTFSSNRAGGDGAGTQSVPDTGGAIAFLTGGTLSISDSVFDGNRAGGVGGAGDRSGSGAGGAVFVLPTTVTDAVDVEVARSVFSGNRAGGDGGDGFESGDGAGGAIDVFVDPGPGSVTVADSSFSGNSAGGNGGGGMPVGLRMAARCLQSGSRGAASPWPSRAARSTATGRAAMAAPRARPGWATAAESSLPATAPAPP